MNPQIIDLLQLPFLFLGQLDLRVIIVQRTYMCICHRAIAYINDKRDIQLRLFYRYFTISSLIGA